MLADNRLANADKKWKELQPQLLEDIEKLSKYIDSEKNFTC